MRRYLPSPAVRRTMLLLTAAVLLAVAGCGKKATPQGDEARREELPPRLVSCVLTNLGHLRLEYDRALDPAPLAVEGNVALVGSEGDTATVVLARPDPADAQVVLVDLAGLTVEGEYTLRLRNLRDGAGRPLPAEEREFAADAAPDEEAPRYTTAEPRETASLSPAPYVIFTEAVRPGPDFAATIAEVLPVPQDDSAVEPTDGAPEPPPLPGEAEAPAALLLGETRPVEARFEGNFLYLMLAEPLAPEKEYQLHLEGVADYSGNGTEEPVEWRFRTGAAEAGYTLTGAVADRDGSTLPPGVEVLLCRDTEGKLPLARVVPDAAGAFTLAGLVPTDARSAPYLLARAEDAVYRYRGFFDEGGDGRPDRVGAVGAGELRSCLLLLDREDVSGPQLGAEVLAGATTVGTTVAVSALDESGVTAVEGFLDIPGNDGGGLAAVIPPWEGLYGDQRLTAYLVIPTADWPPGDSRTLWLHARDGAGNWSLFTVLQLSPGEAAPALAGKVSRGGEPVEGAVAALTAGDAPRALETTDALGRFSLPAAVAGERLVVWRDTTEGFFTGEAVPAAEGGLVQVEPVARPRVTAAAASLVRYAPTEGLTLPPDHLLLEAAVVPPLPEPGRTWRYALGLGETVLPLSAPLSGHLTAYLPLEELTLPPATPPRLLVTPWSVPEPEASPATESGTVPTGTPPEEAVSSADEAPALPPDTTTVEPLGEPLGEPTIWRSSRLDLAELPFIAVTAVDEGTTIRVSWEPLYGVAGYYVTITPRDRFTAAKLPEGGVWRSWPTLLRTAELVIPEGEITDYWGVPGGTRFVVSVCAVWNDQGDRSFSFGELVHP